MINKMKKYHRDFEINNDRVVKKDMDIGPFVLLLAYNEQLFKDTLLSTPELFIKNDNTIFTMSFLGMWYGK